jgi:acetamidase/formamidase
MRVEIEFRLHPELRLALPRARLVNGWLTFGFGRSLDEAAASATVEMVKLMGELHGFSSRQALSLASLVVDLRITQMVNGIRGVHALLRDDSIEQCKEPKSS